MSTTSTTLPIPSQKAARLLEHEATLRANLYNRLVRSELIRTIIAARENG